MSREVRLTKGFLRFAIYALGTLCITPNFLSASPAGFRYDEAVCRQATSLALEESWRVSPEPASENLFVRVATFEPGVLLLDAGVRGNAATDLVLLPAGVHCGLEHGATRPVLLSRTRTSLLLEIESPGDHVFRLSSKSFPELTLRSRFAPGSRPEKAGENEDEIEMEVDPFADDSKPQSAGENEDEIEMEVDPFAQPQKAGENEDEIEMEVDPFAGDSKPRGAGENEDEIEMEVDPFADPRSKSGTPPSPVLARLCDPSAGDDHDDTLLCATTLKPRATVEGRLDNDWGDDVDVFRFELPGDPAIDLWSVALSIRSDLEAGARLLDGRGRQLNHGARLVELLPPGVYYVRVESASGSEGRYRLELVTSGL